MTMEAIELVSEDGKHSIWMCSACKQLSSDRPWAEKHCYCPVCKKPTDWRKGRLECNDCDREKSSRRDRERLEKAEKLEDWDGWVWDENRYYSDLDEYVDHLAGDREPEDWPEWVYVADQRPFPEIDVDRVFENAFDDWDWEEFDADKDLKGVVELRAAVDKFNEANKGCVSYMGDWTRAVRVPPPPPD
jgi:hypothetical protein